MGAAARAMKNMGLSDLVLVSPSCDHLSGESIVDNGAEDIFKQAARVSTLSEALAGIELVWYQCAAEAAGQRVCRSTSVRLQIIATTCCSGLWSGVFRADKPRAAEVSLSLHSVC